MSNVSSVMASNIPVTVFNFENNFMNIAKFNDVQVFTIILKISKNDPKKLKSDINVASEF